MNALEAAIRLAVEAHSGQQDKGGMPYILHPLRLMLKCDTELLMIIAVLHDTIEDTKVTLDDLHRINIPIEAINAIQSLTKKSGECYNEFIDRVIQNRLASKVKELDLLDNMNCTRLNEITDVDVTRLRKYAVALQRIRAANITQQADSAK